MGISFDSILLPISHTGYHHIKTDKAKWMKIGAAWPHQDGNGFSVELELMPVQAVRIHLREVIEKEAPQS